MTIQIPEFSLVALIGVSGSGKSTFAARHFRPTEALSSDGFRGLVSDDENSLDATNDAFDALHYLAAIRLRRRRLVVVDATNVQAESRKSLLRLAAEHDALAVAIVLDLPERLCHARNAARPDRDFGPHVVRNQMRALRQSLKSLRREGFRYVYVLTGEAEVACAQIERTRLWTDRSDEQGPFDIIGDVHGCFDELAEILILLGYSPDSGESEPGRAPAWRHPEGRRAIFLGDLVDRGPRVVETAATVMAMTEAGAALCVPGNHDIKVQRWIGGRQVQLTHGLPETIAQIEALPEEARDSFKQRFGAFVESMVSHFMLDSGRLVVAHAGMKEAYQGRASGRVREFAIWGDTTGETDEFGLPIRYPWAEEYRGAAAVVYGHTPVPEPVWVNRTINIDTGCVFGGRLTALRYPERAIVQVTARQEYARPARPFLPEPIGTITPGPTAHTEELLRAEDVLGKRIVRTRLAGGITVRAENAAAALEVMSRFAVDPRWLIYLPPTMSPCETASEPGFLEHPREAFEYFRSNGVSEVVCQTKHMGSRAALVICRDEETARRRFGVEGVSGVCCTRTGRQFFDSEELDRALIEESRAAVERAGLWEELDTGWLCLDAEVMPWNAKAAGLLRDQYAPVGAAARLSLRAAKEVVAAGLGRGLPMNSQAESLGRRAQDVERYIQAYAGYCWPVRGPGDLRIAPFHLLASEGRTWFDRGHEWHISTLARLAEHSALFHATESRTVNTLDEASQADATAWWLAHTDSGGEGMVVKPKGFVARGPRGLVQPAIKVRGREYLRIIYGPEYTEPQNLERLRARSLGAKRGLAAREFALGVEGLERFVRFEPLRAVHECAFAVLALESEPVDPRL